MKTNYKLQLATLILLTCSKPNSEDPPLNYTEASAPEIVQAQPASQVLTQKVDICDACKKMREVQNCAAKEETCNAKKGNNCEQNRYNCDAECTLNCQECSAQYNCKLKESDCTQECLLDYCTQ